MKKTILLAIAAAVAVAPAHAAGSPFAGRWDITVTGSTRTYPSWMEVVEKGGKLEVRVQGRTGHASPAYAVRLDGERLIVTVSPARPERPAEDGRPRQPARPEMVWELAVSGGKLSGTQRAGKAVAQLAGVRAPALKRAPPKAWTTPEPLFNGKDLTGWEPVSNTSDKTVPSYWAARNGELVNEGKGANLRTTRTFDDFKLHVEYLCPAGENSGIYLRGRYEAQVAPPPSAARPQARRAAAAAGPRWPPPNRFGGVGCIYGFLGPSTPPPFRPDWQTYDITLIGRWVTVVFNGVTTVGNQEIPGITGGALDSNEGEPGPIYLQGDHHGGIRYRNITISVPKP